MEKNYLFPSLSDVSKVENSAPVTHILFVSVLIFAKSGAGYDK